MRLIEDLMYQVSGYFLPLILILIIFLFIYSIFALGDFSTQFYQRVKSQKLILKALLVLADKKVQRKAKL